jgi:octaprenyl-diphosphate synthase
MAEGKLTLPIIYALNNHPDDAMQRLARKVKNGTISTDEIAVLVDYAKEKGGIDYALKKMEELTLKCHDFIAKNVTDKAIATALDTYVDYVSKREF